MPHELANMQQQWSQQLVADRQPASSAPVTSDVRCGSLQHGSIDWQVQHSSVLHVGATASITNSGDEWLAVQLYKLYKAGFICAVLN
jgi:hypothetical protein